MGGNALNHLVKTRRYHKAELDQAIVAISAVLSDLGLKFDVLPAYSTKETFGDLDIHILDHHFSTEELRKHFGADVVVVHHNSNTTSFNFHDLQVDLHVPLKYDFSLAYHSFNDLGNILGQCWRTMGCKLSAKGLFKVTYHQYGKFETLISDDWEAMLRLSDRDPNLFFAEKGFATPEDIFTFAYNKRYHIFGNCSSSSEYSSKVCKKRPLQVQFEKWVKEKEKEMEKTDTRTRSILPVVNVEEFERTLHERFPHVQPQIDATLRCIAEERLIAKELSDVFNAKMVMEETPLRGKDLGHFLTFMRGGGADNERVFKLKMLQCTDVREHIRSEFRRFTGT